MRYYAGDRIIYSGGDSPRVGDPVVGMMDTPELATLAAAGMNALLGNEIPSKPTPAEKLIEGTDFRHRGCERHYPKVYLDDEDRRRIAEVIESHWDAETQTLPAVVHIDPRYANHGRSV